MKTRVKKMAKALRYITEDPPDYINSLPDDVLCMILSKLSIDDAVRSSILAKRWRYLWTKTSHLEFDVEHMIKPFTKLNSSPYFLLKFNTRKTRLRYAKLFFFILDQHCGNMTSCRFLHFPDTNLKTWIQYLFERKQELKDLTLASEPVFSVVKYPFPSTISIRNSFSSLVSLELVGYCLESPSIFESCNNMKTLKLKDIHMQDETITGILSSCKSLEYFSLINSFGFSKLNIQNPILKFLELNFLYTDYITVVAERLEVVMLAIITCSLRNLVLVVPNLREFHCCSNQKNPLSFPVLRTQEILEEYSGVLESERKNIFCNLSSLSVDLNVNNMTEVILLSYLLKSSFDLQTLRIFTSVNNTTNRRIPRIVTGDLPYDCSTFWNRRETCNCVLFKLRFLYFEGFTGTEAEVCFIKYLITRCTKIKNITIVYNCSIEDLYELLLVPRASVDLSIQLKVAERVL